jgi:hypothetical protein
VPIVGTLALAVIDIHRVAPWPSASNAGEKIFHNGDFAKTEWQRTFQLFIQSFEIFFELLSVYIRSKTYASNVR